MQDSRSKTLTLLLMLGGLAAGGQGAAGQGGDLFFDTVDVKVVNIEVVVTDKTGVPVTGLSRGAFTVFEDGEPVELTNFFEVVQGQATAVGSDPDLPPPVPETQRLQLVLFIDNYNLSSQSRKQIFDNLREYLKSELTPEDLVMLVVANDEIEIAQSFTNDPVELLVTLDRLERQVGQQVQLDVEYRTLMRRIQQASLALPSQGRVESSFGFDTAVLEAETLAEAVGTLAERRFRQVQATTRALGRFSDTLAGMKGRKGILYVSDGLPVRAADALVDAWIAKYETWMQQTDSTELMQQLTSLASLEFDASRELRQLVAEANANRVAFYPLSALARGGGGHISAAVSGAAMSDTGGPSSIDSISMENFSREDSLLRLAGGTGGLAYTRSVNVSDLLGQMKTDFTTFYSLGYQRPSTEEDGGDAGAERKIRVDVDGDQLEVRYLKSYQEKTPLDRLEDRTLTALHYGIVDNPLQVRLVPGEAVAAGRGRWEVPISVQIPFSRLLLLPRESSHAARVTILVAARDETGATSPFQRIEVPIEVPNEQIAQALQGAAAYPMKLAMKKGRQRVSVGVRDHLAQIDATLNVELEVGSAKRTVSAEGSFQ